MNVYVCVIITAHVKCTHTISQQKKGEIVKNCRHNLKSDYKMDKNAQLISNLI